MGCDCSAFAMGNQKLVKIKETVIAVVRYAYLAPIFHLIRSSASFFTGLQIKKFRRFEEARKRASQNHLGKFERQIYSQNGEDGIIEEIFKRIGENNKFFVEFGVEDGKQNNTRYLLEKNGWRGVWIEGNAERVEEAKVAFKKYPVCIESAFITRTNIVRIFETCNVPKKFDFLSVDIDGNDYWVLEALLASGYKPRVLVVEYNAKIVPPKKWIIPYNDDHRWRDDDYFGASLESFDALGRQHGYSLVVCGAPGLNAFFVNTEEAASCFDGFAERASYHYVCPAYSKFYFGHASPLMRRFESKMRKIYKVFGKDLARHTYVYPNDRLSKEDKTNGKN